MHSTGVWWAQPRRSWLPVGGRARAPSYLHSSFSVKTTVSFWHRRSLDALSSDVKLHEALAEDMVKCVLHSPVRVGNFPRGIPLLCGLPPSPAPSQSASSSRERRAEGSSSLRVCKPTPCCMWKSAPNSSLMFCNFANLFYIYLIELCASCVERTAIDFCM